MPTPLPRRLILFTPLAALGLVACTDTSTSDTPSSGVAPASATPSPTAAPVLWPLTGEPVTGDAAQAQHPSVAVKVDNLLEARPQWNLDKADIVYEELVEGGISRYVAIFHSDVPKVVGPVRSIRPMDPKIISPFGGIVVYSGGQQKYINWMEDTKVLNVNDAAADADLFFRTTERIAPHNYMMQAKELVKRHSKIAPPPQQYSYADSVDAASAATDGVATHKISEVFGAYANSTWTWSADDNGYVRSQQGTADTQEGGKRVTAVNVVVLRVHEGFHADVEYGDVPEALLVGRTGPAWYSTGGKTLKGTWSKKKILDPIVFSDVNGAEVKLAPGNTWIELVPLTGSFKKSKN